MKHQALVFSSSVPYHDMEVPVYEVLDDWYISGHDLGQILGLAYPADAVRVIFNRHREELEPHSKTFKVIRPSSPVDGRGGGAQKVRIYSEQGCFLITMFAQTPRAKEVRLWLAKLPRKVRQAQEGLSQDLAESERLGAKRGFLVAAAMLDGKVRPAVYIRIRFCRRAGLTQEETGLVLGLSKHRVKELEKSLRNLGMVFPPVNEMERQKRMKDAFAEEIAGGGQRPRPELPGPGHDASPR